MKTTKEQDGQAYKIYVWLLVKKERNHYDLFFYFYSHLPKFNCEVCTKEYEHDHETGFCSNSCYLYDDNR